MNAIECWWEAKKDRLGALLAVRASELALAASARVRHYDRYEKLYQRKLSAKKGQGFPQDYAIERDDRMTFNLTHSTIETGVNLIAKFEYRPTLITSGADFLTRRNAIKTNQFMQGAWAASGVHEKHTLIFRDAAVYGTGVARSYMCDGHVKVNRVLPHNVFIDPDCFEFGDPIPELFYAGHMRKAALMQEYPDMAEAIKSCPGIGYGNTNVRVYEAWYSTGGKGGRYAKFCGDIVLEDAEWVLDGAPFDLFYWQKPLAGVWGTGLAEILEPRQIRIDAIHDFIESSHNRFLTPILTVDGSDQTLQVNKRDNFPGIIVSNSNGRAPQVTHFQAVSQEVYNFEQSLKNGGYEEIGISSYTAQNRLPTGIESAPAQREYALKESSRFAVISQAYENFFMSIAERMISMYAEFTGNRKLSVPYVERGVMEEIDWPKLKPEKNKFKIRVDAISITSSTPAGRQQQVMEWMQSGMIKPEEARAMMGQPDLERSDYYNNSAFDNAESTIFKLLDLQPLMPDPEQDVNLMYGMTRATLLRVMDSPETKEREDIMDNLMRFIGACKEIALQSKPTMQMGPDGQPVAAGAAEAMQGLAAPFAGNGQSRKGIQ